VASFGVRAGFVGKVKADETGRHFSHDLRAVGVHYDVKPAEDGPATARSFILVTPDGERSMNTYLGACQNLTPDDVDPETVRASAIVYLEGYLWDPPAAKEAFRKAVGIAHEAGNRVALTLSDAFCVDRYRDEFLGSCATAASTSSSPTSTSCKASTARRARMRRWRRCARKTSSAS
jgi:sugar/nucleoside kinase (ribokinase family)